MPVSCARIQRVARASLAHVSGEPPQCAPSVRMNRLPVPAALRKPRVFVSGVIVAMVLVVTGFPEPYARADEQLASAVVDEASDEGTLTVGDDTLDELVVVGSPSLIRLKHMVYRAEESFFAAFNEFNDDDEYDVRCFYETPSGSHIRRHVCRANFVGEAESAEYLSWRLGAAAGGQDARAVIMSKRRRLEEKMIALLQANPELADALANYHETKSKYEAERVKQCDGRVIACRR